MLTLHNISFVNYSSGDIRIVSQEEATHFYHSGFIAGDYIGDNYTLSNIEYVQSKKSFMKRNKITIAHSGYNSSVVLFPVGMLKNRTVVGWIGYLDNDGPILCDSTYFNVLARLQNEDYISYGRRELEGIVSAFRVSLDIVDVLYSSLDADESCWTPEAGSVGGYFDFDSRLVDIRTFLNIKPLKAV